jgi:hypothetical protein
MGGVLIDEYNRGCVIAAFIESTSFPSISESNALRFVLLRALGRFTIRERGTRPKNKASIKYGSMVKLICSPDRVLKLSYKFCDNAQYLWLGVVVLIKKKNREVKSRDFLELDLQS